MGYQLFLGGGGDTDVSKEMDQCFFTKLNDKSKILYIPTAWETTDIDYTSCKEWFLLLIKRYLPTWKNEIILMSDNVKIQNIIDFDAIYIGGGNTYKLLDFLVNNNLKKQFLLF